MKGNKVADRVFSYHYDPKEPGHYYVNILWSEQHVMNSPFTVLLAANDLDLIQMQSDLHTSQLGVDSASVIMRRDKGHTKFKSKAHFVSRLSANNKHRGQYARSTHSHAGDLW